MDIDSLNFIALSLYAFYLGVLIYGGILAARSSGHQRWVGIILSLEGFVAAGLQTWMSSKYWFGGRSGVLAIRLIPLMYEVLATALPLLLGAAAALGLGILIFRLISGAYWQTGVGLLVLFLPLVGAGGTVQLISLSELRKPIVRDPAKGEIHVKEGFSVELYSQERFQNPTAITLGPDGRLYVAEHNGDIWSLEDADGDGKAGDPQRYVSGFRVPVGLAWYDGDLYVSSHGKISVVIDTDADGQGDKVSDIVTDLPARIYPWHANNGLVFGADGRLYFSVGSTTNASQETYPNAAKIFSVNPDGSDLTVFAQGVRNPYDLAFNQAGDLFATDNGPDGFETTPGDELNHIVAGGDYGFPDYFDQPPPDSAAIGPLVVFPGHASADGIVFYQGKMFPQDYVDNAFIALWHRGEIYRVQIEKGRTGEYLARPEMFANGFVNPLDLTEGADGALYILDFTTSAVYRVTYTGDPSL